MGASCVCVIEGRITRAFLQVSGLLVLCDGGEGVDEARVGVGLLLDDPRDQGLRAVQQRVLLVLRCLVLSRLRLLLLLVVLRLGGGDGGRRPAARAPSARAQAARQRGLAG